MAGVSTPALAAAVSSAGALGGISVAHVARHDDGVAADLIRERTKRVLAARQQGDSRPVARELPRHRRADAA